VAFEVSVTVFCTHLVMTNVGLERVLRILSYVAVLADVMQLSLSV